MKLFGLKHIEVDKLQRMGWIVEEFLPVDLNKVEYIVRLKFIADMFTNLYSRKFQELSGMEIEEYEKVTTPKKKIKDGKVMHMVGDYFLEDIIPLERLQSESFFDEVKEIQKIVNIMFNNYLLPLLENKQSRIYLPHKKESKYCLVPNEQGILEFRLFLEQAIEDHLQQFPLLNLKESIKEEFIEIITGIPLRNIRRCADKQCNRLFVVLRKKGKLQEYCTRQHMFRYLQQERRKRVKDSKSTSK